MVKILSIYSTLVYFKTIYFCESKLLNRFNAVKEVSNSTGIHGATIPFFISVKAKIFLFYILFLWKTFI